MIADLQKYKWVWFDLDGTLHDFKYSSSIAIEESIKSFCQESSIEYEDAMVVFKNVFKNSQANYFVDGRSSRENRLERFQSLLNHYQERFSPKPGYENELVDIYNNFLLSNLKPYDHVIAVLDALKKIGKRIAIVSEAPFDAQKVVIQKLNIHGLCDYLITSGKERISKSDGLFQKALEYTQASNDEVLVIGDSLERDVYPALSLGIDAYLIDHHRQSQTEDNLNTLYSFQPLLELCEKEKTK